jgi:thiamine kinase
MSRDDIERLCLAIVPGTGAIEVQPLATGLISATYKVARDGVAYALKTAVEPGADRGDEFGGLLASGLSWEARLQELAASVNLAPPLVYADPKRAVMLCKWMAGQPWSVGGVHRPENMRSMAALLRRVHALAVPPSPRVMSPRLWVELYGGALARQGGCVDAALRTAADARMQELAGAPAAGVVCHSDLHRMNLIQDGSTLILLDWEYAHVSDPFWDLAGWAANNDFQAESQRELLTCYLAAEPSAAQSARFGLLMWLYDYVCLLWSELYLSRRPGGANDISRRATLLDARLRLPAHYAAHENGGF